MLSNSKAWAMATATVLVVSFGFFINKHTARDATETNLHDISYTSTSFGGVYEGRQKVRSVVNPVCEPQMKAQAQKGAIVSIELSAPCLANEWVTFHHGGVMFSETLDSIGSLKLNIPAMSQTAIFTASFAHAPEVSTTVSVQDLDDIERVAIQFSMLDGFELHALENDASYGETGHVWARSTAGQGTLTVLGQPIHDQAQMVQIYSTPYKATKKGRVYLSIETEVVAMNCGRTIPVHVAQFRKNTVTNVNLQISVSECDTIGDFMVLNNLIESLNIASN